MFKRFIAVTGMLAASAGLVLSIGMSGASASVAAPAHAANITGQICDNYGAGDCMVDGAHGTGVYTEKTGSSYTETGVSGQYFQIVGINGQCVTWDSAVAEFTNESCAVNNNTEFFQSASDAISSRGGGHNITAEFVGAGAFLLNQGGPATPENQWGIK